jgi:chemosensory pili system protein ChpC
VSSVDEPGRTALRCLLIPIEDGSLLVPNAVIREVLRHGVPRPTGEGRAWFLGTVLWRERAIPLVSFEELIERPYHGDAERRRVVVCAGITARSNLPFYGVAASGMPRLLVVDAGSIAVDVSPHVADAAVLSHVLVSDSPAVIPNLDVVEAMLERELG